MRIVKLKTTYKVESASHPGTWYIVNLASRTCTCPEFVFRMKRIGGICKHISAVEERSAGIAPTVVTKEMRHAREKELRKDAKSRSEAEEKKKAYDSITSYIRVRGTMDTIDLINVFGEDAVNDLIRLGELIEKAGKVRVLD